MYRKNLSLKKSYVSVIAFIALMGTSSIVNAVNTARDHLDESGRNENHGFDHYYVEIEKGDASNQKATGQVLQTEFFPMLPAELKERIADLTLTHSSPLLLAQVCRQWCWFMIGSEPEDGEKADVLAMIKSAIKHDTKSFLLRWLDNKDKEIMRNGLFRFQSEGFAVIEVNLSTMDATNGGLVLPVELAPLCLCVTRSVETFVRPVGDNLNNTLVLLLTLSDLQRGAREISADASFLENVALADLSENSVCALIRHGDDDIAKWGFRYTILKYRETGCTLWEIYRHRKSRGACGSGTPTVQRLPMSACRFCF